MAGAYIVGIRRCKLDRSYKNIFCVTSGRGIDKVDRSIFLERDEVNRPHVCLLGTEFNPVHVLYVTVNVILLSEYLPTEIE